MVDFNSIKETLEENGFGEDFSANPGYNAVEYVKDSANGSQVVFIVDYNNDVASSVTFQEYNNKGVQVQSETVSFALPASINRFMALARR